MKNLFIVKRIVENMNLSDNAFSVWCGLRNIIHKDQYEYFITYNMIAYSVYSNIIQPEKNMKQLKMAF